MSAGSGGRGAERPDPIPLDGLAYGIDGLDALLVVHLGDAHVHGAFLRDGAGLDAAFASDGRAQEGLAIALRDAYRTAQGAARRVALLSTGARRSSRPPREGAGEIAEPTATLEEGGRTVLLRRVRAFVVACVFDASMPLGMARLLSTRLAAALAPELPLGPAPELALAAEARRDPERARPTDSWGPGRSAARPREAPDVDERPGRSAARPREAPDVDERPGRSAARSREAADVDERPGRGAARSREAAEDEPRRAEGGGPEPSAPGARLAEDLPPRSTSSPPPSARTGWPPPPRASWAEIDRTRRLLALLEERAPEPHVAHLRVALRAGLTPLALDHLEALGADAMQLIEAAVEDILGLDRAALRRLA
ncbi:MAG: hypothetical protein IT372_21255 [Polyangiaceae bacterium]|nr:hypothetical protein [Polyangiaceae bacterium]